jgi:hypothetical protein
MDAPVPLVLIGLDLLTSRCFVVGSCDLEDGETFSFSWLGWSSNPFRLLQSTFDNIMI